MLIEIWFFFAFLLIKNKVDSLCFCFYLLAAFVMQLKWKKIWIISTVLMYFSTFLLQTNFEFLRVWAGESNKPRVNIVAVLVDDKIYGSISGEISWYTSYIQWKLADTKALVLPLHLDTVSAYDIYRMMENIYFDWLEDVNSSLIWLIMIWEIPLPVVNQDWYIFPTVYPYVDFEDQKYVWDPKTRYFVPNWNPEGQAEIWHWLINYGSNASAYAAFFEKIENYESNPDEFIWDAMWYEDFIADKEGFLNENYQYYRNKMMFSEDLWYQRYSPLMKSMFNWESTNNWVDILNELYEASWLEPDRSDYEIPSQSSEEKHSTKMIQQEIKDSYLADYNDLFSKVELTTKRENIFAWWRWIKVYENQSWWKTMEVDADSSASMIQLKDTLYGWNDNLVWVIQNFNNVLERFVDKKIEDEKYSMDIVIPVEYENVKWKRAYLRCYPFKTRYENYYFWTNARYVDSISDLSIYRWTYRNLTWISWLEYSDILWWLNPAISEHDSTDITKKSIWASYDIFSSQADGNRWYIMLKLEDDTDEYDANKTVAQDEEKTTCLRALCTVRRKSWPNKCGTDDDDACETLEDFAIRWWWWASVINLDFTSVNDLRYKLKSFKATDAWRPIFEMAGYQTLTPWSDEWMSWTWWIEWNWTWPQWAATNYKAYIKYSSPTEVEWWNRARWWFRVYENNIPNVHDISFNEMNYWQLPLSKLFWKFKQESEKYFTIENKNGRGIKCSTSEKYVYKFVSSVVKHDSTKDDEINWIDRDLYGESWKLWKYYADVTLAYSWLYQDALDVIASWQDFVDALSGKWEELSLYKFELVNAFSWLDVLMKDDVDDEDQAGQIEAEASRIEPDLFDTLSWIEDVLSWSRDDFLQLYMTISSLFTDNIRGLFERIVYIEGGDPNAFSEWSYNGSVTVPFLSSWLSSINSIKSSILGVKDELINIYENAYDSLDDLRNQRLSFYPDYEKSMMALPNLSERFSDLNSWFVNIFGWKIEKEEDGEDVVNEPGDEDVPVEDFVDYVELNRDSAKEVVEEFVDWLEETHKLFWQIFKVDQRWTQIIVAALNDKDFRSWAKGKWIDISKMTQAELITEYAKWAEWDGYDKEWAIKNHELLVWVVEHMAGMNILTSDRPIDSPRYVSMQSIGAKPINLIYPDLFKVEVFELTGLNMDTHILYTWWKIKEKLEEYLKNKVDEYNAILAVSEDEDSIYYRKIMSFDKYATPYKSVRPYKPFTYEEFLEALWWEKMLGIIADILYYQNITNKKKKTSQNISKDISLIKNSFNLNDKREDVLEDYLTEWRHFVKNPILVIPKYELSGYEVAYVNSDGGDYIIPAESITWDESLDNQENTLTPRIPRVQPSDEEEDLNDKCNIPRDWKLPIFKLEWVKATSPWFDGFMCWVRETWRKPIKVKLSFDSSLWEIFKEDLDEESIKKPDDKTFSEWKDDEVQTADTRESLVEAWTWFDADKVIWELELRAERHNREVLWKNSWVSNALADFSNSVKISSSNGILSDSNPTSLLEIWSIYDVGNITVTIEWTWDWCLKIDETVVCNGSKFSKVFNPKKNPFSWVVTSSDHVAWVSALDIKYSLWGDYIEKVVKYRVSPSLLDSATIELWDVKTIAWMITPVEVKGFDQYDNEVLWWLKKYDFEVSQWRFLKEWSFMTGFTTNDFRNLKFYYQAPLDAEDWSEAVIRIVESKDFTGWEEKVLKTYRQRIVQWAPEVRLNGRIILQKKQTKTDQTYKLWSEETIYWANWELDVSKLQRLDLDMKDMQWNLIDIDSQIVVTSQNWLVVIWQLKKNKDGKDIFFNTTMHHLSWWHLVLYYYPTKVSWKDIIEIEIPWLESRIINLNIRPSALSKVQFKPSDKILQIWDEMTIETFLMDKWWNLLDTDWSITIYYDEEKIDVPWWVDGVVVVPYTQWYAKFTAIWIWWGLCHISTSYGSINITVDKHIFPNSWLNILYLNYFGNDWWNQWWYFSDNNHYVEEVMGKSNKIITTTTQLVSQDKIKKMLWKIQPWFQIQNPWNQKTVLTFHWSSFDMIIWEISNMQSSIPSSDWRTVTQEAMETLLNKTPNTDYIFFVPTDSRYWIKNGVLYSWDEKLWSERIWSIVNWEISLYLSETSLDNGDNTWNITSKWVDYWNVVFHIPSFIPNIWEFVKAWDRYLISNTFTDGSTYKLSSVWFFDQQSNFELDTSYKSIQNSNELKEQIWFLWDFKNITLFAEWEIVGEATRKFWSEFVINLWDPVLSRKWKNERVYGTEYDWWIWQEIFDDTEDEIFWTYQIDFNSDWLKDLLVVYLDWRIKLAKNYWWTPDLRKMQELMRVAVSVKEVFIWDVDGNGYEDIIIRTSNNQLRVYKNSGGVFDVDWSLACLAINVSNGNKPEDPTDVSWLHHLEVEDMDRDGKADIITYDYEWYVKVFYWWKTFGYDNYLSKEKFWCDTWWYDREIRNTTVVAQAWLQIDGSKIFDNSMLRRVWMSPIPIVIRKSDLCLAWWVCFNEDELQTKVVERKTWPERWNDRMWSAAGDVLINTDVDVWSQTSLEKWAKYRDVTLYENKLVWWGDGDVYTFVPLSFLDEDCEEDKAYAYKTYSYKGWTLKDWDKVTVTVTLVAKKSVVLTFWDIIQWPWKLYFDDENYFKWLKIPQGKNVQLKKRDWNFAYLLDNISLWWGETFSYSYELEYQALKLKDLSLSYDAPWATPLSNDIYPDIKMQSTDWCDKDFNAFLNMWSVRSFSNNVIGLQRMIDEEYAKTEAKTYDSSNDVVNSNSKKVNDFPGIVWDTISRIELFWADTLEISDDAVWRWKLKDILLQKIQNWWLEALNIWLNIDLNIFEKQTEAIENIVDDITKGMCDGFSFGWSSNCEWLPVPYNQAFFAPWKYHLFWCWDLPLWKLEKWLPVFFFPGTDPVSHFPIPNWQKWPWDSFIWVPGWTYPSMIRIYAAPTLTAQLWIAVCVWSYAVWARLPSPLSDVAGNCVVFAVKPQCDSSTEDKDPENPNEVFSSITEEVGKSKTCSQSEKWIQITRKMQRSSPFNFAWSFFGIAELEISSSIWPADGDVENSITIWDVEILWWNYDVNKIKWWIQQWIRQILIDKWLDPQIRYIVNQLTKMHINIKLPNMANLIWYEAEVLDNVAKSFNKEEKEKEEEQKWSVWPVADPDWKKKALSKAISAWKSISHERLDEFNQKIGNPFESLTSLLNQSNIINITTEPLVVKVPFIMNEDITSYGLYLQQWLEENKKIIDEWDKVITALAWSCSEKTLKQAQDSCKSEASSKRESCINTKHEILYQQCIKEADDYRNSLIEFQKTDWKKMENQIYTNLLILQEYRNFPFEMYEWIHAIDRYMSEIASLISNTIWYLSFWTSTNAERFVWYVDAIVLMLNIIKTYQLIIDFSVDWSQNCGNCAKDTYDQYSCKLSLLCNGISLPIIQIPNFKLPNITIDLTDIDLWLDIVLPAFNFQTVRIDLPELPNLPHPPLIGASIKLFDLPNIPRLPEPPHLPELPSFIPEIELELPILPPAPELPKLPNQIEALIKVADMIWKIYCIVKGEFWMVGESSVKAKIEQLTQRTYTVDRIDNIIDFTNVTAAPIKNYGVDYEISSHVDIQFNISTFYSFLDVLTTNINNLTTKVVKETQEWINTAADAAFNPARKVSEGVENVNLQVEVDPFKWKGQTSMLDDKLEWITSDEVEYVDYSSAKNRLKEVLAYFRQEWRSTTLTNKLNSAIDKIENQISTPNIIESNEDGINRVRDQALEYIEGKKSEYSGLADMINNDYESFLAMIDSQGYQSPETKSSMDSWKVLTFNVNLFNLDSSAEENLRKIGNENPYEMLLDNKQTILNWYWDAVNKNTADDLWLTQTQYLVLRDDIIKMKAQLSDFYQAVRPAESTKLVAKNWWVVSDNVLVASVNAAEVGISKPVKELKVDPANFAEWIYEKIIEWPDKWKLTKVVYSDSFVSSIWDNYYKTDPGEWHDIIMWTDKAIFKKCTAQVCGWDGRHYGWTYMLSKSIDEIPYEEKWVSFWWDTKLKIADWDQEVKWWRVKGQTYDSFTFSWKVESVDAYLIKLVTRIDTSYEKSDRKWNVARYILALPDWVSEEDLINNKYQLEVLDKTDSIKNLISSNQVVEVVHYDKNKSIASVIVSWPKDRMWYYANIATLKLNDKIYNINSPWSNQIVAWKQIVWDDQEPSSEPYLYRVKTDEVVSKWDDLDGYVWTNYILKVPWEDNVALSYINVTKDGEIIDQKYTDKPQDLVQVKWIFRTEWQKEIYRSVWIDQFWNKTEKTITVAYYIPTITVTNISENPGWDSVAITAELSHDMDQWNVSFQRRRWEIWKTMKRKGTECADLPIQPKQTVVIWSPYSLGNEIALYNADGAVVALVNPDTAEIVLQSGYKDSYDLNVWVNDSAIVKVCNKQDKKSVFTLSLPAKELVDVKVSKAYTLVDLPEDWNMWMYNWGKAVNRDGNNVLLISPTGHLYSSFALEWTYRYDRELLAIELTLYLGSDLKDKKNPIKVRLKVQPLNMK